MVLPGLSVPAAQSHLVGGRAMIYTRRGYDWTETFASIAEALRTLTVREVILDGEAVVPDERGISDYHKLQEDVAKGRIDRLVYFAFDLLYLDGVDVRGAQLTERKRLLAELLAKVPENGRIQLSRHIEADASAVFKQACSMNIEGIVAIAAPVTWREMEEQDTRPDQFTIAQPYPPRRKRRPVTVVE